MSVEVRVGIFYGFFCLFVLIQAFIAHRFFIFIKGKGDDYTIQKFNQDWLVMSFIMFIVQFMMFLGCLYIWLPFQEYMETIPKEVKESFIGILILLILSYVLIWEFFHYQKIIRLVKKNHPEIARYAAYPRRSTTFAVAMVTLTIFSHITVLLIYRIII